MRPLASFTRRKASTESNVYRGGLVAQLLAGAWRDSPPQPTSSSQELEQLAPLLHRSGAAGLAWCKVRHSDLVSLPVADQLHQAYRLQSLQAALHERRLKQIIPLLRSSGVEPVLVKGWAIARLYPEPAVRPYTDLDLCVLPDQQKAANDVMESPEAGACNVDLHVGFGKFYERQTNDVFARSRLVNLDHLEVRILSAEDDLRFLCMHLLRHGAIHPLWLCDIGVFLERCSDEFDWDRCLSGSRREADWVGCAIGLAHQLLGVNVEGTPVVRHAQNLPRWLGRAVLEQWGSSIHSRLQIASLLKQPKRIVGELVKELSRHWPNPIEASIALGAPFNRLPRFPIQIGHVISRTTALLMYYSGLQKGGIQQKG